MTIRRLSKKSSAFLSGGRSWVFFSFPLLPTNDYFLFKKKKRKCWWENKGENQRRYERWTGKENNVGGKKIALKSLGKWRSLSPTVVFPVGFLSATLGKDKRLVANPVSFCESCLFRFAGRIFLLVREERRRRQLPTTKLRTWVLVCLVGSLVSSPPLSRLHQRKRYSREEVDGVRKEKERLTTDHQPREIIDGRLTCLFPGTPTASLDNFLIFGVFLSFLLSILFLLPWRFFRREYRKVKKENPKMKLIPSRTQEICWEPFNIGILVPSSSISWLRGRESDRPWRRTAVDKRWFLFCFPKEIGCRLSSAVNFSGRPDPAWPWEN